MICPDGKEIYVLTSDRAPEAHVRYLEICVVSETDFLRA